MPSAALFTMTLTKSRSSLMYCSNLPLLDLVKRRLGDIHMPSQDQFCHVTEEEGEQECADVRSIHVCIRHQNQLAIAKLFQVEVILAQCRYPER